jgi:hypothetical protein
LVFERDGGGEGEEAVGAGPLAVSRDGFGRPEAFVGIGGGGRLEVVGVALGLGAPVG